MSFKNTLAYKYSADLIIHKKFCKLTELGLKASESE